MSYLMHQQKMNHQKMNRHKMTYPTGVSVACAKICQHKKRTNAVPAGRCHASQQILYFNNLYWMGMYLTWKCCTEKMYWSWTSRETMITSGILHISSMSYGSMGDWVKRTAEWFQFVVSWQHGQGTHHQMVCILDIVQLGCNI